ncbi:MAG: ATP-binding protein [Actinomycetota bacterium]
MARTELAPEPQVGGPLDRAVTAGLALFRLVMWAWATVLVLAEQEHVDEPAVAAVVLAVAGIVSVIVAIAPRVLGPPAVGPLVIVEVALGAVMLALGPSVVDDGAVQTFGSAWPVAGVLAAAVWAGTPGGVVAGLVLTAGRAIGEGVDPSAQGFVAAFAAGSLFVLTGAAAGWLIGRLRRSEAEIADTRVRQEIARELHDGVLQTLAVVQRRSDDGELVRLARAQERELRSLIAGDLRSDGGDLLAGLRDVRTIAERWDLRFQLAVVTEPSLAASAVAPTVGAVVEAVNNAGKHASATSVTVFVDVEDGATLVEVSDDGCGFDPERTGRRGLDSSVVRPIQAVGGEVVVDAAPGRGTRIVLRIPQGGAT